MPSRFARYDNTANKPCPGHMQIIMNVCDILERKKKLVGACVFIFVEVYNSVLVRFVAVLPRGI